MPWTLYVYILRDVLKLMVLATLILLIVFSFAAAIKPLSDGLFGPWALMRFVFYTMPTMLTLVLPFAGGFAVTMVFYRIVADNEITACLASGLSYRTILLPIVSLGLVMTLLMFYLSNWVVPGFYRQVAAVVERDVTDVLMNQLGKGQAVEMGSGVVLYADEAKVADEIPPIPGRSSQRSERCIMVRGVVLGKFDKKGRLLKEATAEAADIFFFRERNRTSIEMIFKSAMAYDPARGLMHVPGNAHSRRLFLPSRLKDDPTFLSWPDLSDLAANPDGFDKVHEQKLRLVRAVAARQVLDDIVESLGPGDPGRAILRSTQAGERYYVTAPRVVRKPWELLLIGNNADKVRMDVSEDGEVYSRVEATTATLRVVKSQAKKQLIALDPAENQREPLLDIRFEQPLIKDLRRQAEPVRQAMFERRCRWTHDVARTIKDDPARQLLTTVNPSGDIAVKHALGRLRLEIEGLNRDIIAEINLRGASALGTVLFLLLGALMSMKMGRNLPLIVYFRTFVIAMIAVLITHSGKNVMTDISYPIGVGLTITWLGDVLLAAYLAVLYAFVARH